MGDLWTVVVGVGLALWLAASVVHQFHPPFWKRVAGHDRLRLLPAWQFFAPNPARRDHHLVFRDLVDDRAGPWREVELGGARQSARWLWNPDRFTHKALGDLVNGLLVTRRRFLDNGAGELGLLLSAPYIGLLSWVAAQDAEHRPCVRQFAVVASKGHDTSRALHVVYVSEPHRLPAVTSG